MLLSSRSQTRSMSLAQRLVLGALLLCMALAQSLSIAHHTLHHDVRMLAHSYEEQHTDGQGHVKDCDHGALSRLFAGHEEGDESCRVLDGSTSYLEAFGPAAGILPALYAPVLVSSVVRTLAAWRAPLFEARGPPANSL
jgi:hypothetical protein